jgi:hypothetical protein
MTMNNGFLRRLRSDRLWGFILIGLGGLAVLFSYSSHWWPVTEGVVLRSELHEGTAHAYPVVEYEYRVDGETYRSKKITPVQVGKRMSLSNGRDLIASLPVGKTVQVRFLPWWPSFAVVEPGVDMPSIGILMAGAVILLAGRFWGRRKEREEEQVDPIG